MKKLNIDVSENNKTYILLIGENMNENDYLVRNNSQNDIWFHLDKYSGPHFILKTDNDDGDSIPKRYYNYIGSLFPQYKSKLPQRYTVIYTTLKNVMTTTEIGTVIPKNVKKIKY
jgi:predicted ribosome quality control (RQC) complex YloA/Tae2 family protein